MTAKFDYAGLQNDADEILQEFGFSETEAFVVRLSTSVRLAFDERPTGITQYYINCLKLPLTKSDRDNMIQVGYSEIKKYSKFIVSGKSIASMTIGDYIVASDDQYKVLSFKSVKPYDTALIHTCYVEVSTAPVIPVLVQEGGMIITQEDGKAIGVII